MKEIVNTMFELFAWIKSMYTANELKILAAGSAFGACFSFAVGGMDKQVWALVAFAIADYITGWSAACKYKQVSSRVGIKGMFKKVAIFAGVAVAYWADVAMGIDTLRSMALFGFSLVEVCSLLENIDRLGYGQYIPVFLRDRLAQIKEERGVKM
ncbi:MAG: phage holin family protein [Sporomusa sp.]